MYTSLFLCPHFFPRGCLSFPIPKASFTPPRPSFLIPFLFIITPSKVEDRLTFKALHRMALSRAITPAKEQWKSIFADEKRVDPVKKEDE
jgi:hypothetical protein